ncbi:hypothetical protein [Kitasatospora sp. GP82]|uniref:hypothetical protein n=1 Tax=Kitasatospora sp. GP82 TaxID=3035089 RepID=UPI002475B31A|nr:hypothetical protein [Kitasatospora sp. GP82]MDH6129588.1 hypothetical protein [Kitasatospora sp. GP82]
MTAPGATAPQPGRASDAGRPAGALLVLLLVGLLALLPCAGRAQAVAANPSPVPVTTVTVAVPTAPSTVRAPGAPGGATGLTPSAAHTPGQHAPTSHALITAQAVHGLPVDDSLPLTWCSVDGEHPLPGSGCSNHPFCGQESQLPNAPPQPVSIASAQLLPPGVLPLPTELSPLAGPDHAPDLHVLQVHRS